MNPIDENYWQTKERIGNASNKYQGKYKRVLAVCSGGLLRSPTIAHTLAAEPYNYNTRSVGIDPDYVNLWLISNCQMYIHIVIANLYT
jgi:hypothetical protein